MLPQTDALHATLINNWIDINTRKRWINFTIQLDFIMWTSFYKNSGNSEFCYGLEYKSTRVIRGLLICEFADSWT
jgi:hypothetical protein